MPYALRPTSYSQALLRDSAERDAHMIYKAMKGYGADADAVLEVL